jgi:hypothetical protein
VLDVGAERRGDRDYFGAITGQLEAGGHAAMLHELLLRDISVGPDPRQTIKTKGLAEQILMAQGPEVRFLHSILNAGRLPQNWVSGAHATTIKALLVDLRRGYPAASFINDSVLGRQVKKMVPSVHTTAAGEYRASLGPDSPEWVERSTRYSFPPIKQARSEFEAFVGITIDWDPDVNVWQSDPGVENGDTM